MNEHGQRRDALAPAGAAIAMREGAAVLSCSVARRCCARGLNAHDHRLLGRDGPVLDSRWDDEHLARPELHLAVAKLHDQTTREDHQDVVGIRVSVPDVLALD